MKTSKIFKAIRIARVNAPQWEIYTLDNQMLKDQVNFDLIEVENESLKEYYEELPLNGCYLFAWFFSKESATEFGEWITEAINEDENSVFYANFTIIDECQIQRGEPFFLQVIQLDHEI